MEIKLTPNQELERNLARLVEKGLVAKKVINGVAHYKITPLGLKKKQEAGGASL